MITVYYHWWAEECDRPKYSMLRAPLVLSIATLRAVNPDIRIVVLDGSEFDGEEDWLHFPDKLNFEVQQIEFYLKRHKERVAGWKHLSRFFDLRRHASGDIIYCDSDVFWLKNPLPVLGNWNRFNCDGFNTGFFYYDPTKMEFLYDVFEAYTVSAIFNEEIRELMKKHVEYEAWYGVWDEMIITYMKSEHWGEEWKMQLLADEEHCTIRNKHKVASPRMFHCNGTMVSNYYPKRDTERMHSRGLLCILVKEFYENICKVLDEDDINMIFTPQEREFYKDQKFSFYDQDLWEKMKREDGHAHVADVLRSPEAPIFM